MGPEIQKNSPESTLSTSSERETHATAILDEARAVLGDRVPSEHEDEWSEASATARMDAIRRQMDKGEPVTILELYDANSDADRRQVVRVLTAAEKENRELSTEEETEMIAAQLRISSREALQEALSQYLRLLDAYHELKRGGASASSVDESQLFDHLSRLKSVAAERVHLASQIKDHPEAADELRKQALEYDKEIVRLLIAKDGDVPGANAEGILPVHKVVLGLLRSEYESLTKKYGQIADEGYLKAKERADAANAALKKAFPNREADSLTEEDVLPVLRSVGYDSVLEYETDVAAVESEADIFEELKNGGKHNVEMLVKLTDELGDFQVARARLATIRHHLDQGYALDATEKPLPGRTPTEALREMRLLLRNEQQSSLRAFDDHLKRVESGVLKQGIGEKAETLWNEKGRIFITRIAQRVVSLETACIPDIPGTDDFIARTVQDQLLDGGLYDALGWPRDENGRPKDWADMTPEEQLCLQEKQDSSEKAIDRFRETGVLEKLKTSVGAAKALISRPDLAAERSLSFEEIDLAALPRDTVTAENIDVLIRKYGAATVHVMCFEQLQDNWDGYSEEYGVLLQDFHEIIGVHLDVNRYMKDFGRKQFELTKDSLLLALLAFLGGTAALLAGLKTGRAVLRAGGRGVMTVGRGGLRLSGAALRQTREAMRAARESALMKNLNEPRYLARERQLAAWLKNSRAGRWISNLKFARTAKIARGAGTAVKYGSLVLIPAIGAYEAYQTSERVESAEGNAALQAEYAKNYGTVGLETSGYLFAAVLSAGPQIVLSAPVYLAADFKRGRNEVTARWAHETQDWMREGDPTMIMGKLRTTTLQEIADTRGGGALYPRGALPSAEDEKAAIRTADAAQQVTRKRLTEAYAALTTPLHEGPEQTELPKLAQWKAQYIGLSTNGTYNVPSAQEYEDADMYAELMLQRERLNSNGEELVFPYVDDAGHDQVIDLRKLTVDVATPAEILDTVRRYRADVRPTQELLYFNALGAQALGQSNPSKRAERLQSARESVRVAVLQKLQHSIFKFDALIDAADWPGIDLPLGVSDANERSKNIVRAAAAKKINAKVKPFVEKALTGDTTTEEYDALVHDCEAIMEGFQGLDSAKVTSVYEEAKASLGRDAESVKGGDVNPLLSLVTGLKAE